jgi:predicted aminopeptidase
LIKKIIFGIISILLILIIWNFDLIRYGIRQGIGQLNIVYSARPVEDFLNDPNVSTEIKEKLNYIADVRTFSKSNLRLSDTDNYTEMYDQKGEPVLWVVTGCEPYDFRPFEWQFPFLGKVPYKGFFKKELATSEAELLKSKDFDTGIRTVGGWSTLGWFRDPILSEMLDRNYGKLANLIFHELVHATVFIKDSVEFNENLASFIADKATLTYLEEKFGIESAYYQEYQNDSEDEKLFVNHMLLGYEKLDSLYSSMKNDDLEKKRIEKSTLIDIIMNELDTLSLKSRNFLINLEGYHPNNTYFMSFKRYQSKQEKLETLFQHEFDKDLINFVTYFKKKHPSL